jgi:hypothetical protein
MHLDTELAQHHCARCKSKLTVPAVFRDGEWYHRTCWERGAHQLADANKIADAIKHMHDLYPPIVFLTERESLQLLLFNFQQRDLLCATGFYLTLRITQRTARVKHGQDIRYPSAEITGSCPVGANAKSHNCCAETGKGV